MEVLLLRSCSMESLQAKMSRSFLLSILFIIHGSDDEIIHLKRLEWLFKEILWVYALVTIPNQGIIFSRVNLLYKYI